VIKRVKLTNWKSHADTDLEFLPGTNVLVGVMGAGKSAVLDAISFALYGTFPALSSKKLAIDDCITSKPASKALARVEVFFDARDNSYSVLREVTRGKGTTRSELRKGEALVEGPQTKRVTEEVAKLLGMDYDLFSRAVYSEQNQMDHFLQIPSGQRKKKIDELLKIDRFEEARGTASRVAKEFAAEAAALRSQLAAMPVPDIVNEEKAVQALEQRRSETVKRLEEATESLEKAETEATRLDAEARRAEELKRSLQSAESKLEVYSASRRELEELLARTQKPDASLKQRLAGVEAEIKAITDRATPKKKSEAEKRVALLEAKAGELKARQQERERLARELEKLAAGNWHEKLAAARQEREAMLGKQKSLEQLMKDSEERLTTLAKAGDHCPVCESAITHAKKGELESRAKTTFDDSQAEIADAAARVAAIDIKSLEQNAAETGRLEARISSIDTTGIDDVYPQLVEASVALDALKAAAAQDEAKTEELRHERDGLSKQAMMIDQIARDEEKLARTKDEMARLETEKKRLTATLADVKVDDAALAAARQESKALAAKAGQLQADARNAGALISEKQRLVIEMKERERSIAEMVQRADELEKASWSMDVFKSAVENTQVQLREQFITGVNGALAMVWRQVYPYGDYPGLRLGIEEGDYALEVNTLGGEWVNVEGFASGGERSTAALALRIAFSMVLAPHLSWLVLDEPTHNLDTNGIAQLAKAMRDSLPQLVSQVFVITHDEGMEAAVSGNLYRLDRDKATEEATKPVLVSSGKD